MADRRLAWALFAAGAVLLVGPTVFFVVMHNSYDLYIWLISGPPPFDQFGSGPFQMWLVVASAAGGILCLISGRSLRLRQDGLRHGFPVLELLVGAPLAVLFLAALSLLIP